MKGHTKSTESNAGPPGAAELNFFFEIFKDMCADPSFFHALDVFDAMRSLAFLSKSHLQGMVFRKTCGQVGDFLLGELVLSMCNIAGLDNWGFAFPCVY